MINSFKVIDHCFQLFTFLLEQFVLLLLHQTFIDYEIHIFSLFLFLRFITNSIFAQDSTKWKINKIDSVVSVTLPGELQMNQQRQGYQLGVVRADAINFVYSIIDKSADAAIDTSSLTTIYDHFMEGFIGDAKATAVTQKAIQSGSYSGRYMRGKVQSNGMALALEEQVYVLNGKAYSLTVLYREVDSIKNRDNSNRFLQLLHIADGAHQPYAPQGVAEWKVNPIDSLVSLTLPGQIEIQNGHKNMLVGILKLATASFTISKQSTINVATSKPARLTKIMLDGYVDGYVERLKVTVLEKKDIQNGLYLGRYIRGTVVYQNITYISEVQVFIVNGGCAYTFNLLYPATRKNDNKELSNRFLTLMQMAPGATQP